MRTKPTKTLKIASILAAKMDLKILQKYLLIEEQMSIQEVYTIKKISHPMTSDLYQYLEFKRFHISSKNINFIRFSFAI